MPNSEENHRLKARLFTNGRSQAVRLPKVFRLDAEEVYIWREGSRVILEPVARAAWPTGYWENLDKVGRELDGDFEPLGAAFLDIDL